MSIFDKLWTNIWTKCIDDGDRFEDLARQFGDHGFKDMEVREGDYLRNSEFGGLVGEVEAAMGRYTDEQWKAICDAIWEEGQDPAVTAEDSTLFARVGAFVELARDLKLSYAMSHSWLGAPEDLEADTQQIIQAKKLAYLLCPANARLRIVGLAPTGGKTDPQAAVANVKRYRSLLPNCPMVFAVENSRQPATFTLDLAVQGWSFADLRRGKYLPRRWHNGQLAGGVLECRKDGRPNVCAFQAENGGWCVVASRRWICRFCGDWQPFGGRRL